MTSFIPTDNEAGRPGGGVHGRLRRPRCAVCRHQVSYISVLVDHEEVSCNLKRAAVPSGYRADKNGQRLRINTFVFPAEVCADCPLGPEETNYTIDSAIVLNNDVVYGGSISDDDERKAAIRISVEKNRRGPVPLEWRHRFIGESFYIDTTGGSGLEPGKLPEQQGEREGKTI